MVFGHGCIVYVCVNSMYIYGSGCGSNAAIHLKILNILLIHINMNKLKLYTYTCLDNFDKLIPLQQEHVYCERNF